MKTCAFAVKVQSVDLADVYYFQGEEERGGGKKRELPCT